MSENRTNEFFSVVTTLQQQQQQQQQSSSVVGLLKPNSTTTSTTGSNQQQQQEVAGTKKQQQQFQELRSFHQQAASISKDINITSQLLQQLTDIIKYKSIVFDDNTTSTGISNSTSSNSNNDTTIQINTLIVRIKQSIENLHSRLDTASTTIQQQKRSYGNTSQIVTSSNNVIVSLQSDFANTATIFKNVLQLRTDSLKESNDFKKTLYTNSNNDDNNNDNDDDDDDNDIPDMTSHLLQGPPPVFGMYDNNTTGSNINSTSSSGGMGNINNMFPTLDLTSSLLDYNNSNNTSSMLPRPHGIAGASTTGSASTSTAYTPRTNTNGLSLQVMNNSNNNSTTPSSYSQLSNNMPLTPLDIQRMEEEYNGDNGGNRMLQLLPTQQIDYLQNRANVMNEVEMNIVELGTIFTKLAGLVNEHSELIQRVDDNVSDVNSNVLLSMNVLTDTYQNLKSNKMITLKISAILISFIILFIIFFA